MPRAVNVIHSIRDRHTFEQLRKYGHRAHDDTLSVTLLDTGVVGPPQVAFGLRRGIGGAVRRNRLRRQLRAIMRGLTVAEPATLQGAAVLINVSAGATEQTFPELRRSLERCVSNLHGNETR